jgi:hypothetical protein
VVRGYVHKCGFHRRLSINQDKKPSFINACGNKAPSESAEIWILRRIMLLNGYRFSLFSRTVAQNKPILDFSKKKKHLTGILYVSKINLYLFTTLFIFNLTKSFNSKFFIFTENYSRGLNSENKF